MILSEFLKVNYVKYIEIIGHTDDTGDENYNLDLSLRRAESLAGFLVSDGVQTEIVVTGNYRAWRHFIALRATEHADVEIRQLAFECLMQLRDEAPNVFGDFVSRQLPDGTWVASSPYAERS